MSIDLSLDRIRKLLAHFPVPYTRPTIHVAGTNGKGSVCAYVSSILAAADPPLVVGRFNSPHLLNWLDGISIQNKPITLETFWPTRNEIHAIDTEHGIGASNFEQYTCMALLIFERMHVDVVVLEVGMGGRLDATNVAPDACILVSALTAVDLDHQALLGNTVELITREKAAIARKSKPFILGPQVHRQVEDVAREIVEAAGGELLPACSVVPVEWDENLDGPQRPAGAGIGVPLLQTVQISMPSFADPVRALLPLHGEHQYGNLGTAAGIVSALLTHPSVQRHVPELKLHERLTPAAIARGVRATRWPGRLSYHNITLPADPSTGETELRLTVLADGAHNPASAAALAAYLTSMLEKTGKGPLTLTYILGLSHSPPKTPVQTLGPLLEVQSQLSKTREVRLGAALLAFTQPARMPWISAVPPATIRAAIDTLVPPSSQTESKPVIDIYEDEAEVPEEQLQPGVDPDKQVLERPPRTEHVERALRWAASRRREGEDSLVVLAGSLYLVADFYRLLQKYGQADEIWGAN
ncbi:Mur ligase [Polyporus arcularius HHB13444]|uniref:Mur ligase n=1 Tax=Polyporus arcularius HHB13444 TaxID=1314778 RepID=A0A5C3PLW7_9APHY|nr:Mur ligase [Polyporus arcularius HHB13444]